MKDFKESIKLYFGESEKMVFMGFNRAQKDAFRKFSYKNGLKLSPTKWLYKRACLSNASENGGEILSFEEIAQRLHISHQRVAQIYQQALKKLRAHPELLELLQGRY